MRLQSARFGVIWAFLNPMFQGLAYGAALLLWIVYSRHFPRMCAWLAHAGRMSLTNYVVQVLALELVFSGFAGVAGAEHFAHATLADRGQDFVGAQTGAGGNRLRQGGQIIASPPSLGRHNVVRSCDRST